MMWLTFRQHRIELSTVLLAAALLAVALLIAVQQNLDLRAAIGIDSCIDRLRDPACTAKFNAYNDRSPFQGIYSLLLAFPALVAAFYAAPLFSREFEQGTHRLVWTQGVTRLRWAASKLGIFIGVAAVAAVVLGVAGSQSKILATLGVDSPFRTFDFEGPAFVSYVVFAVALGAAASALLRRSVVAMLVTLLGFVGARLLVSTYLRPNFQPPLVWQSLAPFPPDAWDLNFHYMTAAGADVSASKVRDLIVQFSGAIAEPFGFNMNAYFAANDVYTVHLYQPAERYWLFQSIEATIFLGLAALLVGLTVWAITRRAG